MIFRRKTREGHTATAEPSVSGRSEIAEADRLEADGQVFEAIDLLRAANRNERDVAIERRILQLRHAAGTQLKGQAVPPSDVSPDFSLLPEGVLPEVPADRLSPELLRAAIESSGCLLVRGVVPADEAVGLVAEIDRAFEVRDQAEGDPVAAAGYFEPLRPEAERADIERLDAERVWVTDAGGVWAADSPRVMFDVLESFERAGLRELITAYLGERPAISVNKCTFRKVSPEAGTAWHQDGAFLGDVKSMNVWLSLSHCGDTAPGMDIIPKRFTEIVPTGTDDAIFDWSVSDAQTDRSRGEVPILRPIFEPGDVLLFDDLFLHRTAAEKTMPNDRYAVESWFFGPSAFPEGYVPLVF